MDFLQIRMRVMRAVDTLYARDSQLWINDSSEWSITHRLGVYLEDEFPGWNVDCEYNRQGSGRELKRDDNGDGIRPDVIVHHRQLPQLVHNLLIIEMKKNDFESDIERIREFTRPGTLTRPQQYQFGLVLSVVGGPKMKWFINGDEAT